MRKRILLFLILILAGILRLYNLDSNPPSLSWDEASLGYNAYVIANNLHDEHGEFLPLARFIAFGDYKPPGYIYIDSFFVKFLGLNEFAVRLPSALAGISLVLFAYLLVKELFGRDKPALVAAFMLAVSPWDLHLARAAYEAHLAALFNLIGLYFFFKSLKKGWYYLLAAIFFIFSFYTFNANRIIAPLLFGLLSFLYTRQVLGNYKWFLISAVTGLVLVFPSMGYLQSSDSRLRLQEVSIFNNLGPLIKSNYRIAFDGNTVAAKLLHNRRVVYLQEFLKHYCENFQGKFLFASGDVNPRLAIRDMGQLYFVDLPFVLSGLFFLARYRKKQMLVFALWVLIVPIPAGLAKETPHALRIVSILPAYQIIVALGIFYFLLKDFIHGKYRKPAIILFISLLYAGNVWYYLHNYYVHFPIQWSGEWQYGYKQMVGYVNGVQDRYQNIYVTQSLGRPYIYFAFYKPYSLKEYLTTRKAKRDQFGFWDVESLGKVFFSVPDFAQIPNSSLVVTTAGNMPAGLKVLKTVKNLAGEEVFVIGEKT